MTMLGSAVGRKLRISMAAFHLLSIRVLRTTQATRAARRTLAVGATTMISSVFFSTRPIQGASIAAT